MSGFPLKEAKRWLDEYSPSVDVEDEVQSKKLLTDAYDLLSSVFDDDGFLLSGQTVAALKDVCAKTKISLAAHENLQLNPVFEYRADIIVSLFYTVHDNLQDHIKSSRGAVVPDCSKPERNTNEWVMQLATTPEGLLTLGHLVARIDSCPTEELRDIVQQAFTRLCGCLRDSSTLDEVAIVQRIVMELIKSVTEERFQETLRISDWEDIPTILHEAALSVLSRMVRLYTVAPVCTAMFRLHDLWHQAESARPRGVATKFDPETFLRLTHSLARQDRDSRAFALLFAEAFSTVLEHMFWEHQQDIEAPQKPQEESKSAEADKSTADDRARRLGVVETCLQRFCDAVIALPVEKCKRLALYQYGALTLGFVDYIKDIATSRKIENFRMGALLPGLLRLVLISYVEFYSNSTASIVGAWDALIVKALALQPVHLLCLFRLLRSGLLALDTVLDDDLSKFMKLLRSTTEELKKTEVGSPLRDAMTAFSTHVVEKKLSLPGGSSKAKPSSLMGNELDVGVCDLYCM